MKSICHGRADTADKVYPRGLSEYAAINAQILLDTANRDVPPARRRTQQEREASFAGTPLEEALELLDLWPSQRLLRRYFEADRQRMACQDNLRSSLISCMWRGL